jgi:hypothetical protein
LVQQILRRLPDYQIDNDGVVLFPNYNSLYGHLQLPATFTPGQPLGSERLV